MDRSTLALRGFALLTALLISALCAQTLAADFQTGIEAFERGDYAAALREWRPLAEQGDAKAQYALGLMYDEGMGVPEDDAEAAEWFRKAAEQGLAEAQYTLGFMYANGKGVPKDSVEAVRWLSHGRRTGPRRGAVLPWPRGTLSGEGVLEDYVEGYALAQYCSCPRFRVGDRNQETAHLQDEP